MDVPKTELDTVYRLLGEETRLAAKLAVELRESIPKAIDQASHRVHVLTSGSVNKLLVAAAELQLQVNELRTTCDKIQETLKSAPALVDELAAKAIDREVVNYSPQFMEFAVRFVDAAGREVLEQSLVPVVESLTLKVKKTFIEWEAKMARANEKMERDRWRQLFTVALVALAVSAMNILGSRIINGF